MPDPIEPTPTPSPTPAPAPAPTLLSPAPEPSPAPAPTPAPEPHPAPAVKPDWPEDWRAKLAGDDKKVLTQLERYGSPADIYKKTRELEAKFSSGEYKRDLPKDASPEDVAAWRTERGLPDKADGYIDKLTLPNGLVLGDVDKPVALAFAEAAFKGNVTPEQYSGLVAQYYEMQDKVATEQAEADAAYREAAQTDLRQELGADYKRTVTSVNNLIAAWPAELSESVLRARGADGRLLGDNPAFIRQLAAISRELNPAATLLPSGVSDGQKGVDDQLAEIRKFRQENPDRYDGDKEMQARELKLLEAQQKMQARRPAA
jgi:hypothetical protein